MNSAMPRRSSGMCSKTSVQSDLSNAPSLNGRFCASPTMKSAWPRRLALPLEVVVHELRRDAGRRARSRARRRAPGSAQPRCVWRPLPQPRSSTRSPGWMPEVPLEVDVDDVVGHGWRISDGQSRRKDADGEARLSGGHAQRCHAERSEASSPPSSIRPMKRQKVVSGSNSKSMRESPASPRSAAAAARSPRTPPASPPPPSAS